MKRIQKTQEKLSETNLDKEKQPKDKPAKDRRPKLESRGSQVSKTNKKKVIVFSLSPVTDENNKRISSTQMLLNQFDEEIKKKKEFNKKLQDQIVSRAKGTYKKVKRKQMNCPLCNMRLDSNNNLVDSNNNLVKI